MADDDFDSLYAQAKAQEASDTATAAQVIGENDATHEQDNYQAQIDNRRQQQQPSLLARIGTGALDIVTHPVDDLERAWNGIAQGAANIPYTVESAGFHAASAAGIVDSDSVSGFLKEEKAGYQATADKLSFDTNPNNTGGGFVQGLAQWYAGKAALASVGVTGAATNIGAMTAAFDPDDKHLSDVLAKVPGLPQKLQDVLQTDPNAPEWENRARALFDGVAGEGAAELAGAVVNWTRGAWAAKQVNDTAAAIEATPSTPVTMPERAPQAASGETAGTPVTDEGQFHADIPEAPIEPIRVYHGGDIPEGEQVGSRWYTQSLQDAKGWADGGKVYAVDVPADHADYARLKGDAVNGIAPDTRMEIAGDLDANRQEINVADEEARLNAKSTAVPAETPQAQPVRPEGEPAAGAETGATPAAERSAAQAENVAAATEAAPIAQELPHPATPGLTIDIPPEKAGDVLRAINEGRYADAVGMFDDTHRTIPWDQMSDGPALKNVFNAVEDGIGRLIKDKAGVGPVPQQAIVQLAADIGGNVDSLRSLYSGVTGEGGLAARITAGYNMMTASARQLKELAENVNQLRPDSPEGAQALLSFQKQLNLHGAIVGQVRQSSAEIGRALWAHRQLKSSTDVALSNIQDYAGTTSGTANLQKMAKAITDSADLRSLTNASDAVQRGGFWRAVREMGTAGMLSSPATESGQLI
jgi:hypothetical protein